MGIAILAISFAALCFKKAAPTHPLVSAGVRLAIATVLLLPFTARHIIKLSPKAIRAGILGGVFYGAHFGTWVWSLTLTSVAASVTLVTSTPLLLALWSLITGVDRPSRTLGIALILSFVGISFIGSDASGGSGSMVGDGLAIAGAMAMAGYMLTVRRLGQVHVGAFMTISVAIGSVILLGAASAQGLSVVPPTQDALFWLFLSALIPQLVGHTLLTWCLRYTQPSRVAMATVAEPVGATAIAYLWLGESVSVAVLVGCALTTTAVAIAIASQRRHQTEAGDAEH